MFIKTLSSINDEYNKIMSTNNKSEKQETNWIALSELTKIFNDYEKEIKSMDLKNKIKIK